MMLKHNRVTPVHLKIPVPVPRPRPAFTLKIPVPARFYPVPGRMRYSWLTREVANVS